MAEDKTRRAFVKGAAQVAVTAPAVAVLLNGTAKASINLGYVQGDDASLLSADDSFQDDTFLSPSDDGSVGGGSN